MVCTPDRIAWLRQKQLALEARLERLDPGSALAAGIRADIEDVRLELTGSRNPGRDPENHAPR